VKRSLGQSDGHGSARLEDVFAAQRARISRNLDVRIERMRNRIAVQTYGKDRGCDLEVTIRGSHGGAPRSLFTE
jgi:hypothetical protein